MRAHGFPARRLELALAQLAPAPRDVAANLQRILETVERHTDAEVVAFPELFLSGYTLEQLEDVALDPRDQAFDRIAAAASAFASHVIFGFVERVDGGFANSVAWIDDRGRLRTIYRKAHLFGQEAEAFTPGSALTIVDLDQVRAGLLICFDLEFPEPARALAGEGANLLLTLAANMAPFAEDHALFVRARALENGVWHAYVNRVGNESGFRFAGGTTVVDPRGTVVGALDSIEEGVLRATIDLTVSADPRLDYLRLRRPDLIVDPGLHA